MSDLTQQLRDAADSGRFDALDMDLLREAAEQLAAKDAEIAAYRVLTEKLRVNGMTVDEVLAIVLGRTS